MMSVRTVLWMVMTVDVLCGRHLMPEQNHGSNLLLTVSKASLLVGVLNPVPV